MDTTNHTQLIARLKRQPRHGAGPLDEIITLMKGVADLGAATAAVVVLSDAVLSLGDSTSLMVRGLEKQIAQQRVLNDSYVQIAKASLFLELRNKELNKSFGIGSISAAKFSSKLQGIASELKTTGMQAQQYAISIKKMLPTLNQMATKDEGRYKGLLRVQQILTTNLGLSEKEAEENAYFATQQGKNANDSLASQHALAKAIEDTTGLQGSFKMISQGIAETSADIQLQYGKMPGNLELAILKAKSLGFTMATLKSTADNLLNIESSIGQELEYQLLSGRRLIDTQGKSLTNSYREAALQGNANKQADTLNTILEQEGETLANNLFARQQMSQLLGMDEATLARALQKKSILEKIGGGELFEMTGNALLDAAKGLDGVTQADMDALAAAEDTRTTDEKMLQELELLTDSLINAIAPNQASAVEAARVAAMTGAGKTKLSHDLPPEAMGFAALSAVAVGEAEQIGSKLISAETMEVSQMNVASGAGGLPVTTGKDILSPPSGYGTRTLFGPEGAIQLNNKDTVLAGTDLFAKSSIDNNSLANTMLQVGQMIVTAIKSGGVNLDGRFAQ
jgi:hypothetical protein